MESTGSTQKRAPITCPKCGGHRTIPIAYGMPSQELLELREQGKVRLGGCVVGPSMPDWYCPACDVEFARAE